MPLLVTGSVGVKIPPVTTTCVADASSAAAAISPLPRKVSHCSVRAGENFARKEFVVVPVRVEKLVPAVPESEPLEREVPAT